MILFVKMNNLWADQSFEIMEQCKAFRFHTPSSLMVVCLSGCSKTVFTTKLLVNNLDSFERPPHQIHYCYGAWQHVFELMKEHGINFHEGIPTLNSCPNGFQRVDYWCWMISWKREGTANACWVCLSDIRIIRTLLSCICVTTCSHPVNMLRASPETPTTS